MEFIEIYGEFFVIGIGLGKLYESTLSVLHPNRYAYNDFKTFLDANMAAYFNPTAAFNSAGYDELRSKYKKFLEQKVYYRIEGVMPYTAGF